MTEHPKRTIARLTLLLAMSGIMQGCTQPGTPDAVIAAYDTSGMIPTHPYTQTIFSSHNF